MKKTFQNKAKSVYGLVFLVLLLVLGFTFLVSLTVGRYGISLLDSIKILISKIYPIAQTWDSTTESVIFTLRLPRTLAACVVGAALAVSGSAYQSMFKNPMVSPDILGVSSGATVGASLAILFGLDSGWIQVFAFAGGIIAVGLTTSVPFIMRSQSIIMLVLAGIIVGGLMSSIMGIIKYVAEPTTALAQMTYWAMGSFGKIYLEDLNTVLLPILLSIAVLYLIRFQLNVLSLGDQEAKTLGVNVGRIRAIIIIAATLATASAVSLAGTIGWVGLVIPHLARILIGSDNRITIPVTIILGSSFMILVDTLARTVTTQDLPISIITGLVGAPFFFFLLLRQRRGLQ